MHPLPDFPALLALKKHSAAWVSWKFSTRNGLPTKLPINPRDGSLASVSNPDTWASYEAALKRTQISELAGVGIVLSAGDDLTGGDLDHCVNITDEFNPVIEPWARAILDLHETYAEYSPSGTGIRLFMLGKEHSGFQSKDAGVEIYVTGRYLTVTGRHIPGTPEELAPAPKTLAALRERVQQSQTTTAATTATAFVAPTGNGRIRPGPLLRSLTGDRPSDFFRNVNQASLEPSALLLWVQALFGADAKFYPTTGAWRVSSEQLGRPLQEDLSITPHGIMDFGEEVGLTPIDVVLNFGGAPDAKTAAGWLCDQIGVSRETLGWQPAKIDGYDGYDKASQTENKPRTSNLLFENITDLRQLPPTQWLVKGWLEEATYGIVRGRWGAGKSFLGFDIALHLAYGLPEWHGARLPAEPCDVLVLAREGHTGFVRRIDAFKKHHKIEADTERLTFLRAQINFMDKAEFDACVAAILSLGKSFRLIIVDTVSRVMSGVKINEDQNVSLFMERLMILSKVTNATVIGVHHENKSGGTFGSIYFENNADFVFSVVRQGNGDEDTDPVHLEGPLTAAKITCLKMKDGEDGWSHIVRFKPIDLTPLNSLGIPQEDAVSSLVVEGINGQATKPTWDAALPDRDTLRRVLKFINSEWDAGRPLSRGKNTARWVGSVVLNEFPSLGPRAKILKLIEAWMSVTPPILTEETFDKRDKLKGLKVIGSI